jgi:hypothetical protein
MSKKNKAQTIKPTGKPLKSKRPIPWMKMVLGALIFAAIVSVLIGILLPNAWVLIFSFIGTFLGVHFLRKLG